MKNILLILLSAFTCNMVDAQKLKRPRALIGANLATSTPTSDQFNQQYDIGYGAELFGGVGLGRTIFVGTVGYHLFKTNANSSGNDLKTFPVKVGVRQKFFGPVFLQTNVGSIFVNKSGTTNGNLWWDAGGGIKFSFLELSAQYGGWKPDGATEANRFWQYKLGWSINL